MRRKRKNRFGMGFVFLTVLVLFVATTIKKNELAARHNELQEEKARYEK